MNSQIFLGLFCLTLYYLLISHAEVSADNPIEKSKILNNCNTQSDETTCENNYFELFKKVKNKYIEELKELVHSTFPNFNKTKHEKNKNEFDVMINEIETNQNVNKDHDRVVMKIMKNDELKHTNETILCTSETCIEDGTKIKSTLNETIDPCVDFYEFSCGGWMNSQNNTNEINYIAETAQEKINALLTVILENHIDSTDPPGIQLAKKVYDSCMDIEYIDNMGTLALSKILKKYGGWPLITPNWNASDFILSDVIVESMKTWNIRPLFSIVTDPAEIASYSYFSIDKGAEYYPSLLKSNTSTIEEEINKLIEPIANLASIMKDTDRADNLFGGDNEQDKKRDIREMLEFVVNLHKIQNIVELNMRNIRGQSMSLKKLTHWTNPASTKNISNFDWVKIFKTICNGTGIRITSSYKVWVFDKDYLYKMTRLIDSTPPRVIANFMMWSIADNLRWSMSKALRESEIVEEEEEDSSELETTTQESSSTAPSTETTIEKKTEVDPTIVLRNVKSRVNYCREIVKTYLDEELSYKYTELYYEENVENKIQSYLEDMIKNIKDGFINRLSSISWMDSKTRNAVVEKINETDVQFRYPDHFRNLNSTEKIKLFPEKIKFSKYHFLNMKHLHSFTFLDRLNRCSTEEKKTKAEFCTLNFNAYNRLDWNFINFCPAYIHYLLLDPTHILSSLYGTIGFVIAHEMMHTFDTEGKLYDKFGNTEEWWSEDSLDHYLENEQCIRYQYGKYKLPNTDITTNAALTVDDDIADNGGVEILYPAYIRYIKNHPEKKIIPSPLKKYTSEQLFYIAFAQMWCSSESVDESLEREDDVHSLERLRVNGVVSNSKTFSKVFNCPVGSPMNSDRKCSLFD